MGSGWSLCKLRGCRVTCVTIDGPSGVWLRYKVADAIPPASSNISDIQMGTPSHTPDIQSQMVRDLECSPRRGSLIVLDVIIIVIINKFEQFVVYVRLWRTSPHADVIGHSYYYNFGCCFARRLGVSLIFLC